MGKSAPVYSDALVMEEARDVYLAANGFNIRDYGASTFTLGFGGFRVKFPNVAARKRVIPLHDLHHVLTGYGTDWMGEAEIGAWELRAGCNSWVYRDSADYASLMGMRVGEIRKRLGIPALGNQNTSVRNG